MLSLVNYPGILFQTFALFQRKLIWKIRGSGAIYRTYKEEPWKK